MMENKPKRYNKTNLKELDLTTTVVTILGPMILLFSTGAFIIVILQIDPLVYFIPEKLQWNLLILLFRYIAQIVC